MLELPRGAFGGRARPFLVLGGFPGFPLPVIGDPRRARGRAHRIDFSDQLYWSVSARVKANRARAARGRAMC